MSDDLDELRRQTETGTRAQGESPADESDGLEDAIVDLLAAIEDGEESKTLSVRDARLAALVKGLEEADELDGVGNALRSELDREANGDADRSEVLRLAVRLGLQEAAPEVLDAARDASARHASERF